MRSAPAETCHVCGSGGGLWHDGLRDRLFGVPGKWNLRRCDNPECRLVWLDPKPLESDLHEAYSSYYTHGEKNEESAAAASYAFPMRAVQLLGRWWLEVLFIARARRQIEGMFLDGMTPGRLLEVGCGEGRFSAKMRDRGWKVEGQELDARAAENARKRYGFTIHLGDLGHLALPAETYDAVVMNHVIEHAYDPVALLKDCSRVLRPGGLFVATSPNPDSYGYRKFHKDWIGLDPPRHIHLFSVSALGKVAEKAGFKDWKVSTSPARAGGLLSASLDLRRSGRHDMQGRTTIRQIVASFWYLLAARVAYIQRKDSGEEIILRAWK